MEKIQIRSAELSDEEQLIAFIKEHWYIRDHVFTRERAVFRDCHVENQTLHFLLGVGEETGKIYGIYGYWYFNHEETPDISVAMMQALKEGGLGLGAQMIQEVQNKTGCRSLSSSGIVPKTIPIYQFMGYQTGKLAHYYRLNDLDTYTVAKVEHKEILPVQSAGARFEKIAHAEELDGLFQFESYRHITPYKDHAFVTRKYYDNVGYKYHLYAVLETDESCRALFVGREIVCNGSTVFKIVDYIGCDEALAGCSKAFQQLITDNGYEFIDFYEYGIADELMEQAGFSLVSEKGGVIIPHYFEPFEQRNIDIFFFTTNEKNYHSYRTDGGQERPNYIENEVAIG